jgi:phosphonate transport system permease protein
MEPRTPDKWQFPQALSAGKIALIIVAFLILWQTGKRVEMDRAVTLTADAVAYQAGLREESQVASGLKTLTSQLFPLVLAERTETSRIEGFDPAHLPPFAYLETMQTTAQTLNPDTLQMDSQIERTQVLVEPYGYALRVAMKLLETLEIALWGTVLAILFSLPLAFFGARNLAPNGFIRGLSRAGVSLLRAIPELISALLLVLAYGFGPIAGVLSLAFYGAGFLGKFYADDIEAADIKPQEALFATGSNRLKVLRFAILPQVLPQYIAYTLYVLDRNVRMATVIGLVGAGGIGQELKGRYDMYNYGHVGTILVAIFLLVLILEQASNRLRRLYL